MDSAQPPLLSVKEGLKIRKKAVALLQSALNDDIKKDAGFQAELLARLINAIATTRLPDETTLDDLTLLIAVCRELGVKLTVTGPEA